MAVSRAKKKSKATPKKPGKKRQGDLIFSLDIGTRTVVGILGKVVGETFKIIDYISIPHLKRAMIDGQIEQIDEVAKVVSKVRDTLEKRQNVKLTNVCIAAAGRALRTQKISLDIDVVTSEVISDETERAIEIEAVLKAQELVDGVDKSEGIQFYCVGHTVVSLSLDGYKMQSIVGHKGNVVTIELIAAFLPSLVVESLYAVTEATKLTVSSLTLEPIAAMNVIVPPELRLINVALVDIGAGTSDIAISKDGSIVAYAMATIAGDEITEDIIKKYIVDFDTAERMKLSIKDETITYKDILGLEHTIKSDEFFHTIYPTVELLADTIVRNILDANGGAPSAVFLVGGGSLIPELCSIVAEKLSIPKERVAVGGHNFIKNVVIGGTDMTGPEFVTPIGIGVTSTIQKGFDFSSITLNDKKYRLFDTTNMTVLDLLMIAGYKARQIIGHSGRNLSYTLNGENILLKGEISTPAQLTVNNEPASIDTKLKQGDEVKIIPATTGASASVKVSDLIGDNVPFSVTLDGKEYSCGGKCTVNGEGKQADYLLHDGDVVTTSLITTLYELISSLGINPDGLKFQRGKAILSSDCPLKSDDSFITLKATPVKADEKTTDELNISLQMFTPQMTVILNGKPVVLPQKNDNSPHVFLEVLNFLSFDLSASSGQLTMRINGKDAGYTSKLNENDNVEIFFS